MNNSESKVNHPRTRLELIEEPKSLSHTTQASDAATWVTWHTEDVPLDQLKSFSQNMTTYQIIPHCLQFGLAIFLLVTPNLIMGDITSLKTNSRNPFSSQLPSDLEISSRNVISEDAEYLKPNRLPVLVIVLFILEVSVFDVSPLSAH